MLNSYIVRMSALHHCVMTVLNFFRNCLCFSCDLKKVRFDENEMQTCKYTIIMEKRDPFHLKCYRYSMIVKIGTVKHVAMTFKFS